MNKFQINTYGDVLIKTNSQTHLKYMKLHTIQKKKIISIERRSPLQVKFRGDWYSTCSSQLGQIYGFPLILWLCYNWHHPSCSHGSQAKFWLVPKRQIIYIGILINSSNCKFILTFQYLFYHLCFLG